MTAVRDHVRSAAEPDESLTSLNRLATQLLGVPVSLVSLVDADRQVFVGRHGLPPEWDRVGQTPLSHSICQQVVTTDAPVVIADVRDDRRTRGNLAGRDIDVAAYAGVPLRTSGGETLGSFCAIDTRPRAWTDAEVATLHDLARLAQDQLELRRWRETGAGHDRLTGLLTREVFEQLVQRSLATARQTTVLAFGVDGLRLVNDALGHGVGDQLLTAVADRLSGAVRAVDVVCRLAGDEFLVLLDAAADDAEALASADRLRAQLNEDAYDLQGRLQPATVSVGVATATQSIDAADLIDEACRAMRQAKDGTDRPVRLAERASARLQLRSAIAGADERGELHLAYQPVVDVNTGEVRALEALMRWTHPELGPIGPDQFIPAAELSGAIIALGEWAIRQACADVTRWRRVPGMQALTVGVNVAPIQLTVPTFSTAVETALADHGLPPDALGIEITERTLLADGHAHRDTLQRVHDAGVLISIDDFGTGYSALSYLTQVPAQVLKIDGAFVARMHADTRSRNIVTGILNLADGLDMQTVAEGVETPAQHDALRAAGFDWAQGYLYSRPVPAAAITDLLATSLLPAAPSS